MKRKFFAHYSAAGKVAALGDVIKHSGISQRKIMIDAADGNERFSRSIEVTLFGEQCNLPIQVGACIEVEGELDGRRMFVNNGKPRFFTTLDISRIVLDGKAYN